MDPGFPRYAVYTTPQIPMVTPELFYQQARRLEQPTEELRVDIFVLQLLLHLKTYPP